MHGGVKFYRGSAGAARSYVEADRSRVDDYYLAEGTGLAERYLASPTPEGGRPGGPDDERGVRAGGTLDGPAYERWVAGYDIETGAPKGRLRRDAQGLRFVEVVVNGPKTWSLVAAVHPEVASAYDAAQERAAVQIIGWLADHAATRVGPRGRQVQVPVEKLEAAVVRHYTSRAGDPHRHLHLQINARVLAAGAWRGLHSVGVVDSIEAINGIGHAAVMCDPEFREVLAAHGYTLDSQTGEVAQLAPYIGSFSARAAQITRNIDRSADQASQVISSARAAEQAIQRLCRTTLTRPSMTPAEVDIVLAHLADVAAALPQAARQPGDILAQAKEDHVLEMDTLTEIEDPGLAIDAARLHPDGVGEAALGLYRLLDAAHNETAHIAVADRLAKHTEEHAQDITSLVPRPENRQPPPMGCGGTGPGLRW